MSANCRGVAPSLRRDRPERTHGARVGNAMDAFRGGERAKAQRRRDPIVNDALREFEVDAHGTVG